MVEKLNFPVVASPPDKEVGPLTIGAQHKVAGGEATVAAVLAQTPTEEQVPEKRKRQGSQQESTEAFILGEGLPPVPAKLVAKIL